MDTAIKNMGWKPVYGIVILCILLVAGCERRAPPLGDSVGQDAPDLKTQEEARGCVTAADCMRSGCSGTVCQARDTKTIITTCEWREEYACFREIECGCADGQCAWQMTPAFDACIEEKKQAE